MVPSDAGPTDEGRLLLTPPPDYVGLAHLSWLDAHTLVGVGYEETHPRLGLIYCRNRPSHLFSVSLKDKVFSRSRG